MWIIDDIFKNFILGNSKYKKFGTGNLESLKNITKKDILDYYDKYYTTDNMFVCIVDSKPIDEMLSEYIGYFAEIPLKLSSSSNGRFEKDNLTLIPEELIIFNSSSEYNFVNFYLIMNADEKNTTQLQLVNFINHIIGCEYENSLGYCLKENDIIKSISSNVEYFYDYSTSIGLQFLMLSAEPVNFYKSFGQLEKYLLTLKNIDEEEFEKLYNNFRKIKMLNLLYGTNSDPVEVSNSIVDNMIKGDMLNSIIRQDYVPEYTRSTYSKYIEIIKSTQLKIITNININGLSKDDFDESKWYKSKYSIQKINNDLYKEIMVKEPSACEYKLDNIIGLPDFIIKTNISKNIDKSKLPELIDSNDNLHREIYFLEYNKYDKPIGNISILRKNNCLLDKKNRIVIGIYFGLCEKILNYFLDVQSNYKLNFSMSLSRDYLIYNFNGINYELFRFISMVVRYIYPESILYNKKCKKYFDDMINDMKEDIANFKYNSPYVICSKYLSWLLDSNMLPNEKLEFIESLSFEDFVNKISECLKYSKEYFVLTGIIKNGYEFNIDGVKNFSLQNNKFISDIIDVLSLEHKKYLINQNNSITESPINFVDWTISSNDINPNEVNNCVIRYWEINKIKINLLESKLDIDDAKKIIKTKLISSFVSDILNEPLFDKIRTIDKLGYIVKADSKTVINLDTVHYIIFFLTQSSYSIKRICSSFENFNEFIGSDLKNNYPSYSEKFRLIKESKILEFSKPFSDLYDEINSYIESILTNIFIFDLNNLYLEVCKDIDFSQDIEPIIIHIINNDTNHKDIVLNKNNNKK